MRDLFRFLFRIRITLLFLLLMGISLGLLVNGNEHQKAQAISSSNAVVGQIYAWRSGLVEYAGLREENLRLAKEIADLRDRDARSRITVTDSVRVVQDTVLHQQYRFITARVINSTVSKARNYLTLDKGSLAGLHADMGIVGAEVEVGGRREGPRADARPADVVAALGAEPQAKAYFEALATFYRNGYMRWIEGAKRAETRSARIAELLVLLKQG